MSFQTTFIKETRIIIHLFSQNTGCLTAIWVRICAHKPNNKKYILVKFSTGAPYFLPIILTSQ